jgi:hypothetical protein
MMPSSRTPYDGDIGDGVDDLLEQTTDVVIRKPEAKLLSGTYPRSDAQRERVSSVTEISVSDFQVVEEAPPPPQANPCSEFERVFAAEIAKALPPLPTSPKSHPRAIELMALPAGETEAFEEPAIPPAPRAVRYIVTPAPMPARKPSSRWTWATVAVVVGCLGAGVLIELRMPDKVDAWIDAAASLMSSAQR